MTTLDLAERLWAMRGGPCDAGRAFAEAHPDPLEALDFAVTQPTVFAGNDVGSLVRESLYIMHLNPAVSADLGDEAGLLAGDSSCEAEIVEYTQRCADLLRRWVCACLDDARASA